MGGGRPGELQRHRGGVRAQRVKALRLAVVLLVIATTSAHGEIRRIRVCADASNLPFSSQRTGEPGFELGIARAVGRALGAELSVHWSPTARGGLTVRQ